MVVLYQPYYSRVSCARIPPQPNILGNKLGTWNDCGILGEFLHDMKGWAYIYIYIYFGLSKIYLLALLQTVDFPVEQKHCELWYQYQREYRSVCSLLDHTNQSPVSAFLVFPIPKQRHPTFNCNGWPRLTGIAHSPDDGRDLHQRFSEDRAREGRQRTRGEPVEVLVSGTISSEGGQW